MICSIEGCNRKKMTSSDMGLCPLHNARLLSDTPLDRPCGIKGELNPRWNGGVSEYPNHYLMKKARKEVLAKADYVCFYCGKEANEIHHLDLSKDNHSEDNLVACCRKCNCLHAKQHKPHRSKYTDIYGCSATELAKMLGVSHTSVVTRWHKKGILPNKINQLDTFYLIHG